LLFGWLCQRLSISAIIAAMSELLEKLKKRRAEVDSGGLHFENETQESHCAARADASKYSVALSQKEQTASAHASSGQGNLKDVLDRRRATVDGAGESWESMPEGKRADFTSERRVSQTLADGPRSSMRGQNFQAAIEHQRARVDGCSETWQNDPSEHLADCIAEAGAHYERSGSGDLEAASLNDCLGEVRNDENEAHNSNSVLDGESIILSREDAKEPLAGAQGLDGQAEAEVPTVTEEQQIAADAEIEDEEKMIAEHTEHHQRCGGQDDDGGGGEPLPPGQPQDVLTKGSRITWLVVLDPTHSTEIYQSPAFAVKEYQGVTLELRPVNAEGSRPGCSLRLSGPEPRPANLQVMLFAGKGWKQKHLRPWCHGEDLVQQFDVPLAGRGTLLCGLVFRL